MITNSIMKKQLQQKFAQQSLEQSIWLHTNYRTGSIDELEPEELEKFYYMFFPKQPTEKQLLIKEYNEARLKGLRSVILKDAQYIGLYDPQDWKPFNEFMNKLSVLKKPLNKYTADEFDELIKQFKSLKSKYQKAAKIPGTKEWHHKNKLPMPSSN